jgi:hypothetical protein
MKDQKHSKRSTALRCALLAAGLTAALLAPAAGQSAKSDTKSEAKKAKQDAPTTKGHWGPGDALPDKFEYGLFGGGSFFNPVNPGLGYQLEPRGVFGQKATWNAWQFFGLELSQDISWNQFRMKTEAKPGLGNYAFDQRVYQEGLSGIIYAKPRGSKFRPYFAVGISAENFSPTGDARDAAKSGPWVQNGTYGLTSQLLPAFTFGGGIKAHLSDHWGLDLFVRDSLSKNPTYGLPDTPAGGGIYIPKGHTAMHVVFAGGVNYYFGQKREWIEDKAVAPVDLAPLTGGNLSAGSGTLCQGKSITVRSLGASDPAGRGLTYKWKVNGQAAGGNSPELTFTPDHAGNYTIELTEESANNPGLPVRTAAANTLTLGVQEYKAPTVSGCQAVPAELAYASGSKMDATVTGSACSTTTFLWSASEGSFADPSSASTTFDSKSVKFEQGGKTQAKSVSINGKVTDDRGATASCDLAVKVNYVPGAIRLSDIIFAKGSARVNNCGKRILLEDLAPKAADPDYDIVLIGHYDKDEAPSTKLQKANSLDKQRVLNAYSVLTAGAGKSGKGTCANVDKTRVKADWVAEDQTDDKQPGLCGTSARAVTKERRGSVVSTADDNRRVEVWLVPKGTKLPAGFKAGQDLSSKEIEKQLKTLGCPK